VSSPYSLRQMLPAIASTTRCSLIMCVTAPVVFNHIVQLFALLPMSTCHQQQI
jgi:hypothetical protein